MQDVEDEPTRARNLATQVDRFSWRRILATGIVLFVATTGIMVATGNPNLYPTVVLIGNFLVPMTFVAFLYEHQHLTTLRFESIVRAFVLGGVLGVLGASLLEPFLLPHFLGANGGLGLSGGLAVGAIEEGCKLAAVMLVARRLPRNGPVDGLLLGAAVGMGFAALESTGYAFTVLLASGGDVPASLVETLVRGLLAPFGHGAWTAIAGAAMFSASAIDRWRITGRVLFAYLFVVVLHGAWDGFSVRAADLPFGVPLSMSAMVVGMVGLVTLAIVFRVSKRSQKRLEEQGALPPPAET